MTIHGGQKYRKNHNQRLQYFCSRENNNDTINQNQQDFGFWDIYNDSYVMIYNMISGYLLCTLIMHRLCC